MSQIDTSVPYLLISMEELGKEKSKEVLDLIVYVILIHGMIKFQELFVWTQNCKIQLIWRKVQELVIVIKLSWIQFELV